MPGKTNTLKKRIPTKPKPAKAQQRPAPKRAQSQPDGPIEPELFERIHIKSFRACRGLVARITKHLLNGILPTDRARYALPYIQVALSINHAIQLKERLDAIGQFLQLPQQGEEEADEPEDIDLMPDGPANEPDEPEDE